MSPFVFQIAFGCNGIPPLRIQCRGEFPGQPRRFERRERQIEAVRKDDDLPRIAPVGTRFEPLLGRAEPRHRRQCALRLEFVPFRRVQRIEHILRGTARGAGESDPAANDPVDGDFGGFSGRDPGEDIDQSVVRQMRNRLIDRVRRGDQDDDVVESGRGEAVQLLLERGGCHGVGIEKFQRDALLFGHFPQLGAEVVEPRRIEVGDQNLRRSVGGEYRQFHMHLPHRSGSARKPGRASFAKCLPARKGIGRIERPRRNSLIEAVFVMKRADVDRPASGTAVAEEGDDRVVAGERDGLFAQRPVLQIDADDVVEGFSGRKFVLRRDGGSQLLFEGAAGGGGEVDRYDPFPVAEQLSRPVELSVARFRDQQE